ncbi:uncharacterized protein PRCAT00002986001 [Priceomyces carsonii]|uniref:uncharacterized protein n=1 Tax=Priceomyces carsonii TaxID=28549 RepID=UPI002ED8E121|nr:unnamed protein product [Priceomyces carsonii]
MDETRDRYHDENDNTKETAEPLAKITAIPQWRKLLYSRQPFPDNYTDVSFLSQLKRNTTVTKYSYWKLVNDFSLIVVHMSNLLLVILIFIGIYAKQWNALLPTMISSICTIVGFVILHFIRKHNPSKTSSSTELNSFNPYQSLNNNLNVKPFLRIIVILLVLSPVLKSLTRSTSSDSIWALSFMLYLANTLFHDYAMDVSIENYRPILSTNISLSNSIVLASRFSSNVEVFSFILFAIQVNILLPLFDFSMRKHSSNAYYHRILCASLQLVVYWLINTLWGGKIVFFWIVFQGTLSFVIPKYFLFLQRYKNELQGPWDIANPRIRSN